MRDDFSEEVKRIVASRVNSHCSKPDCGAPTSGPQVDPSKALNIGVAAHIAAASPGGARYDASMTPSERKSTKNAIWLCQTHAKLIDNDEIQFPTSLLHHWKTTAEASALISIGKSVTGIDPTLTNFTPEEIVLLIAAADKGEIRLYSFNDCNPYLLVGRNKFGDDVDPSISASYIDALESLKQRQLIKFDSAMMFLLTGKGFKIARKLKEMQ